MIMMNFIKIYVIAVPIFFAMDLVWLGVISQDIYQKYMGHLMRSVPNWTVAVIFYLLFVVGLVIFAIYPAIKNNSWVYALVYGAMFGFFTYMTFDLTNLAVLKDWRWQIVIIDIIWGIVLSGSVSLLAYSIGKNFV